MSLDEDGRKLVEMAYSGSAESAFVMILGRELHKLRGTRDGAALADDLLSGLCKPYTRGVLSETEKDRLRTMQRLLVATVARFQFPELVDDDQPMQ